MKHEIVDAVSLLLREKGIEKEAFENIIESVFLSMVKRKYGQSDNFEVIFNVDKGDIEIQCIKMIVDDDKVVDSSIEIALSEAKTLDPYAKVGEETMITVDYEKEFGRRIIISAKQHLIQCLREIEKDRLYDEFIERVGEIVIGDIHQITRFDIKLNIDRTEVIMPRSEQVYSERYRRGDSIKAIVLDVVRDNKEPEIIVSRRSVNFVKRLFELEVPEIFDGVVEIKTIAREAGDRTKIAVDSNDKRVDPVGACVGMKGMRIQAIVKELNKEKIDIIHWTTDPELMVRRSLAPVIPLDLVFLEGGNKVLAVIQDDQIAQAIGKKGQNIRLASQLSGYEIEPVKSSDYYQEELNLDDVEELEEQYLELLKNSGYKSAEDVLNTDKETLQEVLGIDVETVDLIIEVLNGYFEESE
ncbi:MAG: transcription termination factor NusA [Candidatus Hatepunaea meridiana]|nr:transcription termination factor NusA [Candidatus Hatepunaea meridiana]